MNGQHRAFIFGLLDRQIDLILHRQFISDERTKALPSERKVSLTNIFELVQFSEDRQPKIVEMLIRHPTMRVAESERFFAEIILFRPPSGNRQDIAEN